MKLKIISDGTPKGTQVVNAATGEILEGVVSVSFNLRTTWRGKAEIRIVGPLFDVEAEVPTREEKGERLLVTDLGDGWHSVSSGRFDPAGHGENGDL